MKYVFMTATSTFIPWALFPKFLQNFMVNYTKMLMTYRVFIW